MVASARHSEGWRCISSTIGVSHLVCHGEHPAPVPGRIIELLRGREDERGFIRLPERPRFAAGDRVGLLDGAFVDWIGLFEGMTDGERVMVFLDLFIRKVRVVLEGCCLTAA